MRSIKTKKREDREIDNPADHTGCGVVSHTIYKAIPAGIST